MADDGLPVGADQRTLVTFPRTLGAVSAVVTTMDHCVFYAVLPQPWTRGTAPGTLYVKGNKCQPMTRSR